MLGFGSILIWILEENLLDIAVIMDGGKQRITQFVDTQAHKDSDRSLSTGYKQFVGGLKGTDTRKDRIPRQSKHNVVKLPKVR